jgi:hypothetical protein
MPSAPINSQQACHHRSNRQRVKYLCQSKIFQPLSFLHCVVHCTLPMLWSCSNLQNVPHTVVGVTLGRCPVNTASTTRRGISKDAQCIRVCWRLSGDVLHILGKWWFGHTLIQCIDSIRKGRADDTQDQFSTKLIESCDFGQFHDLKYKQIADSNQIWSTRVCVCVCVCLRVAVTHAT